MKKSSRAPVAPKKAIGEKLKHLPASKVTHIKLKWPPKDIPEQNRLGDELVAWAVLQEGNKIEDFPLMKLMNPYHFKHIGDDNEYFRNCYEYAQYTIGARLQDGIHAKNEKIDRELGMRLLPLYNREYADMVMRMKTPSHLNQNAGTQFIIMEKMPSSPLVPEREDADRSKDPSQQVQTKTLSASLDGRDRE